MKMANGSNFDELLKASFANGIKDYIRVSFAQLFKVDEWMQYDDISAYEIEKYPNAKAAAEIKSSPLYEALE